MREEMAHPDEDPYRYRVQWGYAPVGISWDWNTITNWTDVPWDNIDVRTAPAGLSSFSAQFQAPSSRLVVAIRALKKWGTPMRELDVNLDSVRLSGCAAPLMPVTGYCGSSCGSPVPVIVGQPSSDPIVIGQAASSNASLAGGQPSSGSSPIVIGQAASGSPPAVLNQAAAPAPTNACTWYTIKRGDTLRAIAARYGTTIASLIGANKIANADRIYAGQRLCIR
jgi:LysM repeat protein